MELTEPLFRCRGITTLPIGTTHTVVTMADGDQVVLSSGLAHVAASCTSFATLDAHAKQGVGNAEAAAVATRRRILQQLAESGLLVEQNDFIEILRSGQRTPTSAPLRTLGMPTCNRAEALERGLNSYLVNAFRHGHAPRAIVTDDSNDPANQRACRDRLVILAKRHDCPIFYAGKPEKIAFIARLAAASAVDPAIVAHALFGSGERLPTYGGNRNALHLAAAGESYTSSDDDTIANLIVPHDQEQGLAFSADHDPTRVRMCQPDEPLPGSLGDLDFLGAHRQVLGRHVAELLPEANEHVDLSACSNDMLALLERDRDVIRISWVGIGGDSGGGSAHYVIDHKGTDTSAMRSDADYHRFLAANRILRAPKRLVIGTGAYCQTTSLAFAGNALLPPFVPSGRGEDLLFGTLLRLIAPASLTAYHPFAVAHETVDRPQLTQVDIASQTAPFSQLYPFAGMVTFLFQDFKPLLGSHTVEARLDDFGRFLSSLGTMPPRDFTDLAKRIFSVYTNATINNIESGLAQHTASMPPALIADRQSLIPILLNHLEKERFLPHEVLIGRTQLEATALVQHKLASYGALCQVWPVLIATAGKLNADGQGLAVPVS